MDLKIAAFLLAAGTTSGAHAHAGELEIAAAKFSPFVRDAAQKTIALGGHERTMYGQTSVSAEQHQSWPAKDNVGKPVTVDAFTERSVEIRGGARFARTREVGAVFQTGGLHNTSETIRTERRLPFGLRYETHSVRFTNGIGTHVSVAANKTRHLGRQR